MKKLLVALTAALGFAAASVPASAGGSYSVSGYINAPAYSYNTYTPRYAPIYNYGYAVPTYSYVAPRYYAPAPVVTFSFGKSYRKHRGHSHKRRHGHKHHRRSHRNHW